MGFNTVAVILNDRVDDLKQNRGNIAERMARAVSHGWLERRRDSMALHFGAGTVISQAHADESQIVIASRNSGVRIQDAENLDRLSLDLMKECLERHGFTVTPPKNG